MHMYMYLCVLVCVYSIGCVSGFIFFCTKVYVSAST